MIRSIHLKKLLIALLVTALLAGCAVAYLLSRLGKEEG